ncbi:amidase [Pseudomonas sp. NPDC087358]|jgi:hypothetical protein|uniref:amidase n=1 Tax=Pseudomonas sp. NPDC087358 TaxID=3364439 RepID=UPI00384F00D6
MRSSMGLVRRRPFAGIAIALLLLLLAMTWVWRSELYLFPSIISAYTAKEYCSCRFVVNNPVDYCQRYVKQWLPSTLTEDSTDKRIIASGMGRQSSAQWQGQRQGCRLLPPVP